MESLAQSSREDAAFETLALSCSHCGSLCRGAVESLGDKSFCCNGCKTVFELLSENGLSEFYSLSDRAGVRVNAEKDYKFLDDPTVRQRLIDFADTTITRVTFRLPAMHCIACVWLLENLFRLKPGIGRSEVNFLRKEVGITFQNDTVHLSDVAALLASLGYEPDLKFSDLEQTKNDPGARRLWMQLGVAGFAFGNIMLLAISSYLGLDAFNGPTFKRLFGWISFALATPVFFYSAADYWKAAWTSLRRKLLTIDVPIAAGILALFGQSVYEVVSGHGDGYFDSLAGLLFFLNCGKLFQRKTYHRLAFDRDYKSFFPLSITRKEGRNEQRVSLSQLAVGDHLVLRNGELLPADARLIEGPALIDYSFVTGESEPIEKAPGDYLYAGGRQVGGAIEVETTKPVSQSYLTSLWGQEAFRKDAGETLDTITNRYSQRFTKLILAIALGAAGYWAFANPSLSVKAFTSVLIVACPCALALAAPFALGAAQRVLARRNVFLKNAHVIENLSRIDAIAFDKTGTLTAAGAASIAFQGVPLSDTEERWVYSMTRHSTHPHAVRIGEALGGHQFPAPVRSFLETAGCGMEGNVEGREIWIGSAAWLESRNVIVPKPTNHNGSVAHIAINGAYRGCYLLANSIRPHAATLLNELAAGYELSLLSGDNEKERDRFAALFGNSPELRFNESPLGKLNFVRERQRNGRSVMMVGDGLNDAGALKQSNVGVAIVENIHAFSPASDVIMASGMISRLPQILNFSRQSVRVVRLSFFISTLYNIVGISIAASGRLSPVVCAILMPLSSATVVAFACGATEWLGRKLKSTSEERA